MSFLQKESFSSPCYPQKNLECHELPGIQLETATDPRSSVLFVVRFSPSWHCIDSFNQILALMFLQKGVMQDLCPVLLLKSIKVFKRF